MDVIEVFWQRNANDNSFYKLEEQTVVDGANWYSLLISNEVAQWLQTQDSQQWHGHNLSNHKMKLVVGNLVDVHEDLYLMIKLKFNG